MGKMTPARRKAPVAADHTLNNKHARWFQVAASTLPIITDVDPAKTLDIAYQF